MLVVCDTSPLNYLVLWDMISWLPRLFGRVLIPEAVYLELLDDKAPEKVRCWARSLPSWVEVRSIEVIPTYLPHIHPGERAAIALVEELRVPLLVDDGAAVDAARGLGITVIRTLGLVDNFTGRGWVSKTEARARIIATNFRISRSLLDELFPPE